MTGLAFTQLARQVREHIGQEHRYAHSVRVARCAEELARRHGADTRKARIAGLLHDLARLYSPERLIAECEARGIEIEAAAREHPTLLHARLGAALARELFGIEDAEVLSAIEKHTTAAGEMSRLDCIVYLADSLEPERRFPERAELWRRAMLDLHGAMRETVALSRRRYARKIALAEARASAS
ncbi:MAG TPA: bis(5'-nucleosyl)-tetraphosphatase (symmetrical) YqeK [Candidatus Dormibacteraeota bacterium]|nr:bis(5'-nucleosyl)-tetraphosphatase (symmetrical) YqeK [Candidatus Dormibacteraeota bacterium]